MPKKLKLLSLEAFPNSFSEPFILTSPETGDYNCIAWALEDTKHFYWTGPEMYYNWFPNLPKEETIASFVQLFEHHGYAICSHALKEKGFTKIALFEKNGLPTHAARQLSNGFWTSKLGVLEDVRHTLSAISGGLYGEPVIFLKKRHPKN